jgi:hypothetical protein
LVEYCVYSIFKRNITLLTTLTAASHVASALSFSPPLSTSSSLKAYYNGKELIAKDPLQRGEELLTSTPILIVDEEFLELDEEEGEGLLKESIEMLQTATRLNLLTVEGNDLVAQVKSSPFRTVVVPEGAYHRLVVSEGSVRPPISFSG